ncbi:hypothetical protein AgCh_013530 [Apium graveolens]
MNMKMNPFLLLHKLLLFMSLIYVSTCQETLNPHTLPRPLILETRIKQSPLLSSDHDDDVTLHCTSWRFAVESNNLSPWKTIPQECKDYVKDYMSNKGYKSDLERVAKESLLYASGVELKRDGMDAWVFDIDETLLSNLPYYVDHGYGLEVFDSEAFDKWVDNGIAQAIESSLKLYEEVVKFGFKVFLLTGRSEMRRNVTVENLSKIGFHDWDYLILRGAEDHKKTATQFKSEKRRKIMEEGYRIHGNSGDQWSDLLGSSMSARSFKLPNPMYYIA